MKSCILFRLLLVTYPRKNASMQAIKSTHTSETLFPCIYISVDYGHGTRNELLEAL